MTTSTSARPQAQPRSAFKVFRTITTRWMDNDAYGHVNNVVYYSWFDTAVNAHLMEQGALDIHHGDTIGLVIETQCNYFSPLAFPQTIAFAWPNWVRPACATSWACLRKVLRCAPPTGILCMCMSTKKTAGL
jgi:Thioesterase superfamily